MACNARQAAKRRGNDERFEVMAEPDAAKVGERVYVEATRVIAL